ncbi:MAG TPA: ATP-binding protein [Bryobacteraceae bacterium]|nr:ATP-binding protein [Bryobacteraceae bacterium]
MKDFLAALLSSDFMPHGCCYLWKPGLIWLHVVSDALIALAYFSIPVTLIHFIRKRRDLPFHWMFISFGIFISACAATHVMEIWTLWHANYWLSGAVKAVTALASVATAIVLVQLVPQALALPSPEAMRLEIAERKRTEQALSEAKKEAEAANLAKSVFLANVNHELRTPLTAILGFSRLLGRKQLPRDVQEDLRVIQDNGKHLLMLINHVLDLAKIESGRTTLNEVPTDLHQLLDDLQRTFAVQAEDEGLLFRFERSPGVPRLVQIDQLRLSEVLINLLGNALKFTREGSVTLRVAATGDASPSGCRLTFEVSDTGCGISAEELETVFEAFVQSQTGRESRQGTGLGLTISSSYVRLMGGELRLESEVGHGTTARFEIPVRIATTAPATEVRKPVGVLSSRQWPCRILVADDAWAMRHLIQRLLGPLGFEVREASDGSEAVEVSKEWHPHLIWMDLRMPVMDGFEATRRIKAAPEGENTIIIAVTASSFEDPRAAAREAGCDGFLRKPFDDAELFEFLHQHLGIQFAYAPSEPSHVPGTSRASSGRAIASLPVDLRARLRAAAAELDVAAVQSVLDEIARSDSSAVETLRALTANYQYAQLLRIIDIVDTGGAS